VWGAWEGRAAESARGHPALTVARSPSEGLQVLPRTRYGENRRQDRCRGRALATAGQREDVLTHSSPPFSKKAGTVG